MVDGYCCLYEGITLFVFVCVLRVVCFCFVFLRLVFPVWPVSLDCPFLIAHLIFSDVYLQVREQRIINGENKKCINCNL